MTFADNVIAFYKSLPEKLKLPAGIELIYPYKDVEVLQNIQSFYTQFYSDNNPRIYLWGINPGRFGAGVTGIPFTDPIQLEKCCNIPNNFDKKPELSSIFIYDIVERMGGPAAFYSKYYISSLCPMGFVKEGKNFNYYDDRDLFKGLKSFMVESMDRQINFQSYKSRVSFSLGKGTNLKYFKMLNTENAWYDSVIPLPHPRWVMQYQRRNYEQHLDRVTAKLLGAAG